MCSLVIILCSCDLHVTSLSRREAYARYSGRFQKYKLGHYSPRIRVVWLSYTQQYMSFERARISSEANLAFRLLPGHGTSESTRICILIL